VTSNEPECRDVYSACSKQFSILLIIAILILVFILLPHNILTRIWIWTRHLRRTLPFSLSSSLIFIEPTLSLQFTMACRNLCQRFDSRVPVGKAHYGNRNKYCRRCEVYFFHDGVFCPCCGMALRGSLPPNLGSFVCSLLSCMSSVNVKIIVNR
jgi:hypothetical protein